MFDGIVSAPWPKGRTGKRPVPWLAHGGTNCGAARRRKPTLLFVLPGSFLLRFAAVQFTPLLFQLPPRMTRSEPLGRSAATGYNHGKGAAPAGEDPKTAGQEGSPLVPLAQKTLFAKAVRERTGLGEAARD